MGANYAEDDVAGRGAEPANMARTGFWPGPCQPVPTCRRRYLHPEASRSRPACPHTRCQARSVTRGIRGAASTTRGEERVAC